MLRFPLVLVILQCWLAHCGTLNSISPPTNTNGSVIESKDDITPHWYALREEAAKIREEAQKMRTDAYDTMRKAFQMKEEAMEFREAAYQARMEMETSMVEALSLLKTQASATTLYVQDMRTTLNNVKGRLDVIEDRMEDLERNLEDGFEDAGERFAALEGILEISVEKTNAVGDKVESNNDLISSVQTKVEASGVMTASIKSRQEVTLEEVRIISLYKMSDQTTTLDANGHHSGLAVDGQFVFSHWDPGTPVRTVTHTSKLADQKLWIDLGGLFRIHRVQIWNARHCPHCLERFIGTHTYADKRLLGVAVSSKHMYDYKVDAGDPIYARSITLHQVRVEYLHVSELQVWGSGPFAENDKFA